MNDLKSEISIEEFYKIISCVDIEIEEEDIFYRRKYNDISNYFKTILTHNENSLLYDYSKIFSLKGLLLIKINPNSDIKDFLKLLSKNYFLDVIELDYERVFFSSTAFLGSFQEIVQDVISLKNERKDTKLEDTESMKRNVNASINKVLIIDENQLRIELDDSIKLLELFINSNLSSLNFIEKNSIVVWITNEISNISNNSDRVFDIFDLFINFPPLDRVERESVLKHFSELYPKIVFDIDSIANYSKLWEIYDFKHLIKLGIFKHYIKSELNQKSNEITDILIELIESKEFIPSVNSSIKNGHEIISENLKFQIDDKGKLMELDIKAYEMLKSYRKEIQGENISDFMLNQLYEDAASKHYKELQIIIEKISKKEVLEENDRSILAKYPFILEEKPQKALIALEKANKKINRVKQMFKRT